MIEFEAFTIEPLISEEILGDVPQIHYGFLDDPEGSGLPSHLLPAYNKPDTLQGSLNLSQKPPFDPPLYFGKYWLRHDAQVTSILLGDHLSVNAGLLVSAEIRRLVEPFSLGSHGWYEVPVFAPFHPNQPDILEYYFLHLYREDENIDYEKSKIIDSLEKHTIPASSLEDMQKAISEFHEFPEFSTVQLSTPLDLFRLPFSNAIYISPTIKKTLIDAGRTRIEEGLLRPAADLIILNNEGRHNHQSWYNSGVGVLGFVLEDPEYIWYALLKDDSSLNYQLDKSVTTDGMWYEGSMHYQFYVLRALQPLMEATHHAGFNVYDNPQYKGLFDFMVTYADPELEMPTINDGRVVNLTESDRVTYYELAYRRLGDPRYVPIIEESRRTDLNALLYGVPELGEAVDAAWETELYSDSDLMVLRSGDGDDGIQATLNFMGYQGGHSHADQLSLVLYGAGTELAPDTGSIKYRIAEQEAYFKTTLAHNALVVDGVSQERAPGGELMKFSPLGTAQIAQVRSSDLYDGVTLQRTVLLNEDYLIDFYEASSEEPHTYDWVYRNRGNFSTTSDQFAAVDSVWGDDGYSYLTSIESAEIDGDLQADWRVSSDAYVRATLIGQPDTTYITARGPIAARKNDEISGRPIPMVISRRADVSSTQFVSIIQPYGDEAELLEPTDIAVEGESGRALEIVRDGATDLLILDEQFNTKQADGLQFTGTWNWLSRVDGALHWAMFDGTELTGDGWRLAQEDLSGLEQPKGMGMYFEVKEDGSLLVTNTYEFVSFITMQGFLDSTIGIIELDLDGNAKRNMPIKTNGDGVVKFLAQPGESYAILGEAHADSELLEE